MANGNNNGKLKIRIISGQTAYPVTDATVQIASTGNPDQVIEENYKPTATVSLMILNWKRRLWNTA